MYAVMSHSVIEVLRVMSRNYTIPRCRPFWGARLQLLYHSITMVKTCAVVGCHAQLWRWGWPEHLVLQDTYCHDVSRRQKHCENVEKHRLTGKTGLPLI